VGDGPTGAHTPFGEPAGRQNSTSSDEAPPNPATSASKVDCHPGGPKTPRARSSDQRPPPAARAGQENPTSGESQDVFVALAGPEDEKAVPQVVGEPRDHHHADDGTAREGRKQSDDEQNAGHQLRDARRPRVEKAGTHPEALEPPTGSGDLPASEDVVPSVSQENGTYSQAKDQQPHICRIAHCGPSAGPSIRQPSPGCARRRPIRCRSRAPARASRPRSGMLRLTPQVVTDLPDVRDARRRDGMPFGLQTTGDVNRQAPVPVRRPGLEKVDSASLRTASGCRSGPAPPSRSSRAAPPGRGPPGTPRPVRTRALRRSE